MFLTLTMKHFSTLSKRHDSEWPRMLFLEREKLRFSMKRHRLMFYTLVKSFLTSLFGTCRSSEDTHNKKLGDKRKGKHTHVYLGDKTSPRTERLQPTLHAKRIEDIPCVPLREPITAYLLCIISNVFIKTIQGLLNRQIFLLWMLAPGSDSLLKSWQRPLLEDHYKRKINENSFKNSTWRKRNTTVCILFGGGRGVGFLRVWFIFFPK